jgi:hypothetical protein
VSRIEAGQRVGQAPDCRARRRPGERRHGRGRRPVTVVVVVERSNVCVRNDRPLQKEALPLRRPSEAARSGLGSGRTNPEAALEGRLP